MKKFFTFVMALVATVALNAATEVTFDFSDATAYGYAQPEAGKYAQVNSGDVLTKDDVKITITFEAGKNGFRFFANTNTGAVNLRGYVGATFTIAAPEGKKLAAITADGTNLTATYLADGMTSKNWTSEEGVASLTTNVIKSTVQFNTLKITLIEEGEVPPTQETVKVDVAGAIAAGAALETGKTSEEVYEVTGYVVNAEEYSTTHNNQIWWMADDAENTGAQEFEAYACTVVEDNVVMQVLNGDKVTLTGSITKYNDTKNNKIVLEIKNGTAVFVSKVDGDHSIDGGVPAGDPDTISVARAIAIGDSIGTDKTTKEKYVVEGYVIDAEAFHQTNKNQTWTMADDAAAASSTFKAYRCVPMNGTDTLKVLKGDKVRICGNIQNYKGTIEISNVKAEFISMVEGDHSYADKPQEKTDTITVARALEIGGQLEANKTSDSIYVIAGYVSKIESRFDTTSMNETFWMTDEKDSYASSNAEGAFEVYRGKMDTAADWNAMVYVTAKIYKYQKMKDNQPSGDPVIETSSNPVPTVHVEEPGVPEVIESITVARALEIGDSIGAGNETKVSYEITGYVSYIQEEYSSYGNETFWITDEKGARTNDPAKAFEVYHGAPNTAKEIGYDAKIRIVCTIKNYKGTIENGGQGSTPFEVLEQGTMLTVDTITVREALAKISELEEGATTFEKYVVKGYIAEVTGAYDSQFKNMTITLTDKFNKLTGNLSCYRAKIAEADVAKAVPGAYVHVYGNLQNYKGDSQVAQGGQITMMDAPKIDTVAITVAQAAEIAAGLEKGDEADIYYAVTGYVADIIEEGEGTQSFWMSDSQEAVDGELYIDIANIAAPAALHQQVRVYGWVGKDSDGDARILGGDAEIISAEGIEQLVLTEKAQKVVVDGAIYIIRDNKLFNLQGAQVR